MKPRQFLLSDVISKRTTFSQPFPPLVTRPPGRQCALILFKILALYKSFTYLLTYLPNSNDDDVDSHDDDDDDDDNDNNVIYTAECQENLELEVQGIAR